MPGSQSTTNAKGATVTHTVKVNGQAIPSTLEVFSFTVVKEVNRIPWAKITIIDGNPATGNFPASNDSLFVPGNEVELFVGYQSQEKKIFKGTIVKHGIAIRRNGTSQLKLECRDKAFQMTVRRNSNYFSEIKDSDVAKQLCQKYGLNTAIEDTSVQHANVVQYDITDWDFVLSRLDGEGKIVIVDDGSFTSKKPDFNQSPVLTLQYGENIHEFDAEMDARNQYSGVKAQSWDYSSQELLEAEAQEPTQVKENGNISSSQLSKVNGNDPFILRYPGKYDQQELQIWASAWWQKSRMAKTRGRVRSDGSADVKPGTLIELKGVGDRFSGKVWVSGVRHDVAEGGWTTDVQFGLEPEWFVEKFSSVSPATQSMINVIQGLHTGVVKQIEKDPSGEDRILVKLPLINVSPEGTWARVATLDAGENRGTFFRPEVGDEVLVGFINNDAENAVVLGMLNSSKKPAPLQAEDANNKKGVFFKSKMKMLFNDQDKSMQFETPGGNKVVLSEKDKGITLQDQNGNKLLLNQDGITLESSKKVILKASSGDIEVEGMNLKQKASMQFKAEGSAGVEVSSSAVAVIKGSLVQIN
jgi:Rhs element Vgr protein